MSGASVARRVPEGAPRRDGNSSTPSMRDISATEFARRVGMAPARARQLFKDGEVPTAYPTPGGRWMCAEWAIHEWQRTRSIG